MFSACCGDVQWQESNIPLEIALFGKQRCRSRFEFRPITNRQSHRELRHGTQKTQRISEKRKYLLHVIMVGVRQMKRVKYATKAPTINPAIPVNQAPKYAPTLAFCSTKREASTGHLGDSMISVVGFMSFPRFMRCPASRAP